MKLEIANRKAIEAMSNLGISFSKAAVAVESFATAIAPYALVLQRELQRRQRARREFWMKVAGIALGVIELLLICAGRIG